MIFNSKRKLKKEITELNEKVDFLTLRNSQLVTENDVILKDLMSYQRMFPLLLDAVVYDVQLKGANGRYTKTKACKEYSQITEVVVTKKNYFNIVEKFTEGHVFLTRTEANKFIDSICIE